jgi:hypothetical protein
MNKPTLSGIGAGIAENMNGGGGYRTANITVEIGGKAIVRSIKQLLVDDIRILGAVRV